MPDREKVIKGLEYAWEYIRERPNPTATPKATAMAGIKKAIALLKEQEAVEPIDIGYGINVPYPYRCGKCKSHIRRGQKYCDMCGQAVKWE